MAKRDGRAMASVVEVQRSSERRRSGREVALIVLEIALAIGALGGAIGLLTGWLDLQEATSDLPLDSPVLAGIALAVCNGVLPLVAAVAAIGRARWASTAHLAVGVALVGWIVVQVLFIGFGSPLQAFYLAYGLVILGLATLHRRAAASVPGPSERDAG